MSDCRFLVLTMEIPAASTNKPLGARRTKYQSVTRWQHRRIAEGTCRQCGNRLAPGSRSRCLACLEERRQDQRRRRGIMTCETSLLHGRPMLGIVGLRTRELNDERARRKRRLVREIARLRHELLNPNLGDRLWHRKVIWLHRCQERYRRTA